MHPELSLGNEVSQAEFSAPEVLPGAPAPAVEQWVEDPRDGRYIKRSVYEGRQAATRARNTANQRACRTRRRAAEETERAAILADLGAIEWKRLPPEEFTAARTAFGVWLTIDAPMQRQYRRRACAYLAARKVVLEMRLNGVELAPAEFARRVSRFLGKPIDRSQGRQLLKQSLALECKGGPWPAVTASAEPSRRAEWEANYQKNQAKAAGRT